MQTVDRTIRAREHFGVCVVDIPETRISLHKSGDGLTTCALCSRPFKANKRFQIVACGGWLATLARHEDADVLEKKDSGYMGAWSIGSECARSLRKMVAEAGVNPDDYVVARKL